MVKILGASGEILPGYRLVRFLGRGGFGEVWEAEAPGGVAKAVKITPLEHEHDALNCRELSGLQKIRSIRHPYLLSIERFEIVDGHLVIVMELAERSLGERLAECQEAGLPGIPRAEVLGYMREAAEVLDLLNQDHELQHLDVKPENLFLLGGHIKVADFGLVESKNAKLTGDSLAITPAYAAPELFDGMIEESADQYSLAVTYQELLTGLRPYRARDVRGLIFQHLSKEGPDLSLLPPQDRPILRRALDREPEKRFKSCKELVDSLEKAVAFAGDDKEAFAAATLPRSSAPTTPFQRPTEAKPLFVRHPTRERPTAQRTVSIHTRPRSVPVSLGLRSDVKSETQYEADAVRVSFLAFLPLEIYACKLRGFIDELEAEIVGCVAERTTLRFRSRGLVFPKGVFLQVDAACRDPRSDYRVVEATVWSSDPHVKGLDLAQRGVLLIRYLKAYLMATDRDPLWGQKTAAQIRSEIFGTPAS